MTYCATTCSIPPRPVLSPSITEAGKDYRVHQEQADDNDDDGDEEDEEEEEGDEEDERTLFQQEGRPSQVDSHQ